MMKTTCEHNDERLLAYLLDELDPRAREAVEAHVAECGRCAAELESLRTTVDRLHREFEDEAEEPRLSPARVEELKAGNVEPVGGSNRPRRFDALRWGAWAAVALFGLIGVITLLNQPPRRATEDNRELMTASETYRSPGKAGTASGRGNKKDDRGEPTVGEVFMDEVPSAAPAAEREVAEAAPASEALAMAPSLAEERPRTGAASDGAVGGEAKNEGSREALITGRRAEVRQQVADAPQRRLQSPGAVEPGPRARSIMPPPRPTPTPAPPNDAEFDAMYFHNYGVNPFIDTAEDARSTFAADVDTASYTIVRNYLNRGALPPPEAVRVEEFVNYFEADYPAPRSQTFAVYSEVAPSPWREGYSLLRIGLKGREVAAAERKPVVLTFVVDVSGSMARENRLGLVKRTLAMLLQELRPGDRVGLAVYGTRGEEVLSHYDVTEEGAIERGIARLQPGGSTNAEEGLRIGYAMARRAFDPEAVNRVILCTDGVANVGRTGADSILNVIGREAEDRIYLTTLGFGLGNYNDVLLEQLADKGNGHYAYLDSDEEARTFIRRRLAGSMEVIAQDVKIQVELDPAVVRKYRLMGYENRDVADRDFRNDRVDAGEINAGHTVTALYEIKFEEESEIDRLGVVRLRFKDPEQNLAVREIEGVLDRRPYRASFDDADSHFRLVWIAAQFAEILRGSIWARELSLTDLIALLDESLVPEARGVQAQEARELRNLMIRAERLVPEERPGPAPMEHEDRGRNGSEDELRGREDEVPMREMPRFSL